jgi:hypothetical protein
MMALPLSTDIGVNFYNDSYKNIQKINSKNVEDKELKKVCDDFESFFMRQLMEISLKESSLAGEGTGNDIIKGLYIDGMSRNTGGTVGISSMIYDYLSQK